MLSRKAILAALVAAAVILPAFALAANPGHVPGSPSAPSPRELVSPDDEKLTIVRDASGVAHVYARTPFALGFGNGYAQAEDRLVQLDILRHVGKGDSAAFLGPAQLASDLEVRRELYTDAEREAAYAALPDFERALFEGFAAGVNRYIAEAVADPLKLDAAFYALGHAPEPWTVVDTIAIAQFLLDYFGAAGGSELENARLYVRLATELGPAAADGAFRDVAWVKDPLATPAIPPEEGVFRGIPEEAKRFDAIPPEQRAATLAAARAVPFGAGESLVPLDERGSPFRFQWGSNAVIVSPALSRSGGGLLGGGPQMGYYSPMVPYEVGLHGAGFDVAGIGIGGAPGVVIGRTATFSWTVTSGIGDQVDVVAEKLVPGNPRQYYHRGEVRDMECRIETHVVKSAPPTSEAAAMDLDGDVIVQEACRTVHGPVFAIDPLGEYAFAKERSHRLKELESGLRWLTLGRQDGLDGFRERLSDFAFTFNFHYVDADHLYFQHVGYQPVRDPRLDPRLPRPGTGEFEWQGMMTGDDLPRSLDPARGWIVNWNNIPQRGWSGGDTPELWGSMHRVDLLKQRFEAALRASPDGKLSSEDVARVVEEAATRDPFARRTVPHLVDAVERTGDARDARAARFLSEWKREDYAWRSTNGNYSPAHAIYDEWRERLQTDVFGDELGSLARPINFDPPTSDDPHGGDHAQHRNKDALLLDAIEGRTAHAWCDDVSTPRVESCDRVLVAALREALDALEVRFGTEDMAQWTMPEHKIRFIAVSASPAWEFPMMNRASFNHLHDWGVRGNRDAASVLPPGTGAGWWPPLVLGNYLATGTLERHHRDQLDLYESWQYKPFRFFRDHVEEGAESKTDLSTWVPSGALAPPHVPV